MHLSAGHRIGRRIAISGEADGGANRATRIRRRAPAQRRRGDQDRRSRPARPYGHENGSARIQVRRASSTLSKPSSRASSILSRPSSTAGSPLSKASWTASSPGCYRWGLPPLPASSARWRAASGGCSAGMTRLYEARAALAASRRTAVFSGAGLSAESGIATFRGNDGHALWSQLDCSSWSARAPRSTRRQASSSRRRRPAARSSPSIRNRRARSAPSTSSSSDQRAWCCRSFSKVCQRSGADLRGDTRRAIVRVPDDRRRGTRARTSHPQPGPRAGKRSRQRSTNSATTRDTAKQAQFTSTTLSMPCCPIAGIAINTLPSRKTSKTA